MSRTDRVYAALRGDEVDRVPVSAWWHDFPREWSAADLAAATLEAYREYDFDFIKVNPRATYYGEAFGAQYEPFDPPDRQPRLIAPGVSSPEDLRRIGPVPLDHPVLAEHLEGLSLIAKGLDGEAPFVQTVFSPLASMSRITGSTKYVQKLIAEAPDDLLAALDAIAETLAAYAAACVERGAAGVFYATVEWGSGDVISAEDYERFARPGDLKVLAAARDAPFNVLHVCREDNHLAKLLDYPVHAFQWASRHASNPSLADILPKTDRALLAGVDHVSTILNGGPEDVAAQARDAIAATGGRRFLLAPECSIQPDTPPANIRALVEAARS
jgi:uroporphyrinogen decarboxylase